LFPSSVIVWCGIWGLMNLSVIYSYFNDVFIILQPFWLAFNTRRKTSDAQKMFLKYWLETEPFLFNFS